MKITLQNLTKTFPSRNKKVREDVIAVNNFDFEIPDGKLIGLLGPSGCGKSTALNLLCGLLTPTSGKIFFGDDDVTNLPAENRGVGMVFQNYALYPHLTVRKNIMFPLENLKGKNKMTKEAMEAKALEAAKLVQIDELMDRKPSELSGGQQQRVAIARALVKVPRVLLLDEPLSNLDARLRLQTREEIRRIQKETGVTTIFVTHDQEEAMSISDLIVVMEAGIIQQIGKPQDVYDDPTNLFVARFLGTPPINVFSGRIEKGGLYIGSDRLFDVTAADSTGAETGQNIPDQPVTIGIRPEGFILGEGDGGALTFHLTEVEVMGRDITVVSSHPDCQNVEIRSIISSENRSEIEALAERASAAGAAGCDVRFDVKPHKVHLFSAETGQRIYFAAGEQTAGVVK